MTIVPYVSDPRAFTSEDEAYAVASAAGSKTIWAIVSFADVPIWWCFTSQVDRHAEENVISSFGSMLSQATLKMTGPVARCKIVISHSPCLPQDPHPSNALAGWPVSCSAKLTRLAEIYSLLQFDVGYLQDFRTLQTITGDTHMGETLYNVLNNTPLMHGGTVSPLNVSLVASLLSGFYPQITVTTIMAEAVAAALHRLATHDKGFERSRFLSERKQIGTIMARTVEKTMQQFGSTEGRRAYLSQLMLFRIRNPLTDMATFGIVWPNTPSNLTIRALA